MITNRVNMLRDILAKPKASKAPIKDNGIENSTTNGREKLLYNTTITIYTNKIAAKSDTNRVPKPSSCIS